MRILFSGTRAVTFENCDDTIEVSSSRRIGDVIFTIATDNDASVSVSMAMVSTMFDLDTANDSELISK